MALDNDEVEEHVDPDQEVQTEGVTQPEYPDTSLSAYAELTVAGGESSIGWAVLELPAVTATDSELELFSPVSTSPGTEVEMVHVPGARLAKKAQPKELVVVVFVVLPNVAVTVRSPMPAPEGSVTVKRIEPSLEFNADAGTGA